MGGIANGIAYHGGFIPYVRHVPDLQRLHARLGPAGGAVRAARRSTSGPTTRSASARTARPTSRSSTTRPSGRSRTCGSSGPATRTRRPPPGRWRSSARDGPVALALTRQKLPTLPGTAELAREGVAPRRLRPARGVAAATPQLDPDRRPARSSSSRSRPPRRSRRDGHPDAGRVAALLGALRRPGRRPIATRSCRRRSASGSASRPASRSAGSAGSATRARSSGSTTSARRAPAGTIFEQFGFTRGRVADVGRRVVRDGAARPHPDPRAGPPAGATRRPSDARPRRRAASAGRRRPIPATADRPPDARRLRRRPRRCRAQGRAASGGSTRPGSATS